MTGTEFANYIKNKGYYVYDDGHIYNPKGKIASRQARNGYYCVRKYINGRVWQFMEHRIVWSMIKGSIDDTLVINHINFDRTDNRIENLELITQKENVRHAIDNGRMNTAKGEDNGRSVLTNKEVQLVRYLCDNGYNRKQVADMFGVKHANLISRVATGARYGSVIKAKDVVAIYPLMVEKNLNASLNSENKITNCLLGLSGEIGEVVDLFKKYKYQGHDLDVDKMIDELGDVMFYLCGIANELGVDFSELCYSNIQKLEERYPDGFSVDRSINRAK